jgi:hypothetical protein
MEERHTEILPHFIIRFGNKLNPKISSVKFERVFDKHFITTTYTEVNGDISTYSTNLDFIHEYKEDENGEPDTKPLFDIGEEYDIVIKKVLEQDDHSLLVITNNFFTEEYTKEILERNTQE